MFEIYRKLYQILDPKERRLTLMVFGLMLVVALFEAVGVASIMPFMAVLANPAVVQENQYLASIYDYFGFQSTDYFLFFLGIAFLVLIVGSLALRAFAFWVQVRFSMSRNHEWSCRLVRAYLSRDYQWFLNQHSGNLGSAVLHEVQRTVDGALFPAIQMISQALVVILLLTLMVSVDPLLALSVAVVLGGAYIALYMVVRGYLANSGKDIQVTNRMRFKISQDMFGGIKDVKIGSLEAAFIKKFESPSRLYAQRQVTVRVISEVPSFAMQAFVFGGIMVVLLYFVSTKGGLGTALPVFALFALAGYRLMPALQSIYRNLSDMKAHSAVLETLHSDFTRDGKPSIALSDDIADSGEARSAVGLKVCLELKEINFSYPNSEKMALSDINLTIPARSKVGLVGSSGSGKTTLVDLILGLLKQDSGSIIVDGQIIDAQNIRCWQSSIGYVPQQIFLVDDSVAANIAFGIPGEDVDMEAVERAARAANLHDFLVNEMVDGYDTLVGERGVRLSGGQRQRIGIARALYSNPDVLIMDEATSALDNLTEQAVMEAVHNLSSSKTIILIAHRLSTVKDCDVLFYMERGAIVASGTYDDLILKSQGFKDIASISG